MGFVMWLSSLRHFVINIPPQQPMYELCNSFTAADPFFNRLALLFAQYNPKLKNWFLDLQVSYNLLTHSCPVPTRELLGNRKNVHPDLVRGDATLISNYVLERMCSFKPKKRRPFPTFRNLNGVGARLLKTLCMIYCEFYARNAGDFPTQEEVDQQKEMFAHEFCPCCGYRPAGQLSEHDIAALQNGSKKAKCGKCKKRFDSTKDRIVKHMKTCNGLTDPKE